MKVSQSDKSHLQGVLCRSGNIASIVVQSQFKKAFGLESESEDQYANTKGWLISIATAGAVFGCLGV